MSYSTALDIDHENDRYTAFTIIVLGEYTYAILFGSPARGGLNTSLLRGVWTLVVAFCFNSMYVYQDGSMNPTHPARRSVYSAFLWLMLHLPMSAGLLIGGHVSALATGEELTEGQRWLLGGGLAVGFPSLWLLAMLFKDGDPECKLLMPKASVCSLTAAFVLCILCNSMLTSFSISECSQGSFRLCCWLFCPWLQPSSWTTPLCFLLPQA